MTALSAHASELPVGAWRWLLRTFADNLGPVGDVYKPYVEGLEHLPVDGRFLIVGNHTMFSMAEILLIPYYVRNRAIPGWYRRPRRCRRRPARTDRPPRAPL